MSLLLRQFRAELRKLFARKRTYIGFGAFFALELLVLALFQLPKVQSAWRTLIERAGYVFESYFSGVTLALIILMATFLLTMLYLALVGGDMIAKEVEDGTLRMTLCRPVSRVRLLLVKYAACVLYTFALVLFVGVSALAVGLLRHGAGGLFVWAPEQQIFALYEWRDGVARFGASLFFYGLSFLSITTLAFALSSFNMKPAAATICALTYFFVDFILFRLPYFESIKGWFITRNMESWTNIFREQIPWERMLEDYAYLLGVNATLVVIAALVFQSRDFKS
jgi:ABC-2 type transport system permease protein